MTVRPSVRCVLTRAKQETRCPHQEERRYDKEAIIDRRETKEDDGDQGCEEDSNRKYQEDYLQRHGRETQEDYHIQEAQREGRCKTLSQEDSHPEGFLQEDYHS